jgi:carboxymethylenebutenolidase
MIRGFMRPGFLALLFILIARAAPAQDTNETAAPMPSTPGQPVGRVITLSDFGAEDLGYLSVPNTPPTLAIVLVPDAFGLDDFTKAETDRLAGLGYLALAVDIYNGHRTTDPGEMANLTANLQTESVLKTMEAAIRVFHESPKFKVGHVVLMGWGTGATYVFQEARRENVVDGAIMFYGPVETNVERIGKVAVPICAIYPNNDPTQTHDSVQVFEHMMKDAGNDFQAWFIAAGAGWSDPASKNYNPIEDKEAWKVAMPFLVRIGAEPVKSQKGTSLFERAKEKIQGLFHKSNDAGGSGTASP